MPPISPEKSLPVTVTFEQPSMTMVVAARLTNEWPLIVTFEQLRTTIWPDVGYDRNGADHVPDDAGVAVGAGVGVGVGVGAGLEEVLAIDTAALSVVTPAESETSARTVCDPFATVAVLKGR